MSGSFVFPRAHERRAHRARLLALRAEHVAVDDQRLLVAEQVGERDLAALAFEFVFLRHLAARRQRAAQFRDALDVAAQLDLLGEQFLRARGDIRRSRWENAPGWRGRVRRRVSAWNCPWNDLVLRWNSLQDVRQADPTEVGYFLETSSASGRSVSRDVAIIARPQLLDPRIPGMTSAEHRPPTAVPAAASGRALRPSGPATASAHRFRRPAARACA